MKNYLVILLIFSFLFSVTVQLKETIYEKEIIVQGFFNYEYTIGKKGAIFLKTNQYFNGNIFDPKDIEEKTKFQATIIDNSSDIKKEFIINGRLWNSDNGLLIFLYLNETIPQGDYIININSTTFTYNEYIITILANDDLLFNKLDKNIMQLYSEVHNITVEDGKDLYELKFMTNGYYPNEIHIFKHYYGSSLDNCNFENEELKCFISKSILDQTTLQNGDYIRVCYFENGYGFKIPFSVSRIYIYYLNLKKENIYVGITKLIDNMLDYKLFVAFETNVTNIPTISTHLKKIKIPFKDNQKLSCGFKKYDEYPLLLLCSISENGTFTLEIKEEMNITDINIRYNFIIQPVNNIESFFVEKDSFSLKYIDYSIPQVLDFSSTDSLNISFNVENSALYGVTFNKDGLDLQCEKIKDGQQCIVPIYHFEGKKSGYYFVMHTNHFYGKTFSYEIPPIKIILPDPNDKKEPDNNKNNTNINTNETNDTNYTYIIIISIIGVIIIIELVLCIIFIRRKKVNSSDIEVNNIGKISPN